MLKFSGLADLISCYKRCDDRSSFQTASTHSKSAAALEDSRSTFSIEHFSQNGEANSQVVSGSSVVRRPLCELLYQAGAIRCMCQTPGPSGTQRHTVPAQHGGTTSLALASRPERPILDSTRGRQVGSPHRPGAGGALLKLARQLRRVTSFTHSPQPGPTRRQRQNYARKGGQTVA